MSTELIDFYATDGIRLNGYINKCENKTQKILISIHGMTSNCFKERDKVIARELEKINIDTMCFNNRGSEIVKYIKNKDGKKIIAGTAYENIEESYCDIVGAINYAKELGYTSIYLQGHSLGSTKVVFTYNKMKSEENELLNYIKGIILLSLVDIPDMINTYASEETLKYAEDKEKKNEMMDLMPEASFINPISVKNFLRYTKYSEDINFAQYSKENDDFYALNSINIPLFMRWGNINEMIKRDASELVDFMRRKIKNDNQDIDHIDGADHSYTEAREVLAKQITKFLTEKCNI